MSKNSHITNKNRILGKNFEYRVRKWLVERGWKASRVPVSGAARGFKNDIHAIYQINDISMIRVEIECKKTNKKNIRLFFETIRKIDFKKDEMGFKLVIVVFATIRSDLYCIIPKYLAQAIIPSFKCELFNYSGKESVVIKVEDRNKLTLDPKEDFFFEIVDKSNNQSYMVGSFNKVVKRLENYDSG